MRLINDPFGIVLGLYYLGYINSSITKVDMILDDEKAGKNAMLKDSYGLKYKVIPIQWLQEI